jgi:hypothetical protein
MGPAVWGPGGAVAWWACQEVASRPARWGWPSGDPAVPCGAVACQGMRGGFLVEWSSCSAGLWGGGWVDLAVLLVDHSMEKTSMR